MLIFDVRGSTAAIIADLDRLQREKVPAATVRALNKAAIAVRAEAVRQVRGQRALSATVIRNAIGISKATKSNPTAIVAASGRPIPLREYAANQTRRGVTVRVTPAGGRKLIFVNGNHAFTIGRFGGHVYVREGKKRLPIRKLYGPSIPTAMVKDAVMAALDKVGHEAWPKRFTEELRYELSKG